MDEKRRHYGEFLSSGITDSIIMETSDPPIIISTFRPKPAPQVLFWLSWHLCSLLYMSVPFLNAVSFVVLLFVTTEVMVI